VGVFLAALAVALLLSLGGVGLFNLTRGQLARDARAAFEPEERVAAAELPAPAPVPPDPPLESAPVVVPPPIAAASGRDVGREIAVEARDPLLDFSPARQARSVSTGAGARPEAAAPKEREPLQVTRTVPPLKPQDQYVKQAPELIWAGQETDASLAADGAYSPFANPPEAAPEAALDVTPVAPAVLVAGGAVALESQGEALAERAALAARSSLFSPEGGDLALPYPPSAGERDAGAKGARIVGRIGLGPHNLRSKQSLSALTAGADLSLNAEGLMELRGPDGEPFWARTTLDPALQARMRQKIKSAGGLAAAVVALDPLDGRVLAMAGSDSAERAGGAALAGGIPAASVFKIVTAIASMERNDFDRDSVVLYDGGKHTLFKSNVVKEPDEGKHKISIKDGFAQSVNAVFAKLGVYTVGPEDLAAVAGRLRFNESIPFEIPVEPSHFAVMDPDDAFHLAELSSGFNRETTLSPLHGAMLAGSAINGGMTREPWFIREVADGRNNLVYEGVPPAGPGRAMSEATALELQALMEATIQEGTGRRRFADAASHKILSDLTIGGKSGTINDSFGNHVDWFVGFAYIKGKKGAAAKPLALAAVVVHSGRSRVTSQDLVREAIINYYKGVLDSAAAETRV
jgi:hypothetical protein